MLENISNLNKLYTELPIHSPKEIKINGQEIADTLKRRPGDYLKEITSDLEKQILYHNLPNEKEILQKYIQEKYY